MDESTPHAVQRYEEIGARSARVDDLTAKATRINKAEAKSTRLVLDKKKRYNILRSSLPYPYTPLTIIHEVNEDQECEIPIPEVSSPFTQSMEPSPVDK